MAYLGNSPVLSQQEYRNIDDISGSFNGVTTSFALLVNGVAPIPGPQTSNQCLISVNGVIQKPDDTGASGFRISGGNIVFSSAPTGGQTFFGVILAGADYIYAGENFPDGTVSAPTITFAQDLDTGFYRSGAGEVKFTANGVNTVTFSSNGLTAPNFIPSGSSVPTNGVYLPSANNVAIATNSTQRLLIDSSGQIEAVSLGSAAAPTWSFTTDPNTGIYSPGADQVAISTGGSGRLFVDASGNVGAGTSSPAFAAGGGIQAKYATFSSFRATVGANTGTDFSAASDGKGYVYVRDNADLLIGTNNTERLRITAAGLVGVGTSSPGGTLDVGAVSGAVTSGDLIVATGSTAASVTVGRLSSTGNDNTTFNVRNRVGTSVFYVDTGGGRVGIGTTSPAARLEVSTGAGTEARITSTIDNNADLTFYTNGVQRGIIEGNSLGLALGTTGALPTFFVTNNTERARIDSSGRLLVGTSTARSNFYNDTNSAFIQLESASNDGSALALIQNFNANTLGGQLILAKSNSASVGSNTLVASGDACGRITFQGNDGTQFVEAAQIRCDIDATPGANDMPGRLVFSVTPDGSASPVEAMRINQTGTVWIGNQGNARSSGGAEVHPSGYIYTNVSGAAAAYFNRITNDGTIVDLRQDNVTEGTISVSGTTVSYNGAHLSRWSQLPGGQERTEILRGSVLSNIDEMCEWGEEDNEQLNRMKVSDVEGDKNVSGVFQAWDDDDDTYTNDFYCAMTGDFIIRIAADVTVERGDLLMSAGDGTAKPQGDGYVQDKTIAKVTSTNVSCTYDDGSYCVPCVLMAC